MDGESLKGVPMAVPPLGAPCLRMPGDAHEAWCARLWHGLRPWGVGRLRSLLLGHPLGVCARARMIRTCLMCGAVSRVTLSSPAPDRAAICVRCRG